MTRVSSCPAHVALTAFGGPKALIFSQQSAVSTSGVHFVMTTGQQHSAERHESHPRARGLARIEPLDRDALLVRVRGAREFAACPWALFVPDGLIVPAERLKDTERILTDLGYQVLAAAVLTERSIPNEGGPPLPECADCHRPLRRGQEYATCPHCGADL